MVESPSEAAEPCSARLSSGQDSGCYTVGQWNENRGQATTYRCSRQMLLVRVNQGEI